MIITVTNEVPFQILSSSFSIGPSQTGYELQVGADSRSFSTLFSVGANTPRMVTNVANGSYFRLKNNVGDVKVNWQRVCVDEGGGGASGTELSPVTEFPAGAEAGTVVAYSGSSSAAGIYQFDGTNWIAAGGSVNLDAYWTSAQTQSAITAVEDHLFDVEEVTASALTELHEGLLEVSARTGGDSGVLKGVYDFPEDPEIGDMVSKVDEMPTFWWNHSDLTTQKMHIDPSVLDTGETYVVCVFESKDNGELRGILEYDDEDNLWVMKFYDQYDNYITEFNLDEEAADLYNPQFVSIEAGNINGYVSVGFLLDDFSGQGGYMLQAGWTDGAFGGWIGDIEETGFVNIEIDIDGIPGIPDAAGPWFWNGNDWVAVDAYVTEPVWREVNTIITALYDLDDVVSAALVDLNEKKVESQDVKHMVKLTQADYDDLVNNDEVDPETFYIIISNNN